MKSSCAAVLVLVVAAGVGASAQRTKTGEVPLAVSISDGSEYRIQSDQAGPYVDGQAGVRARFDQYGNLIVNFDAPRKGPGRLVSFDYSCPYNTGTMHPECGLPPLDPPSGLQARSYISTVCPSEGPCTPLQTMTVGAQQCVQLNWQFLDGQGRTWRNGFHRNRDLPDQEGTAYGVVTRTSADAWTVEPSAAACQTGAANVARTFQVESVSGAWVYTDKGMFWLPFHVTLTRVN